MNHLQWQPNWTMECSYINSWPLCQHMKCLDIVGLVIFTFWDCCKTPRSRHSSQHYRSLLSVSEDNVGETKRRNRYFATVPWGNVTVQSNSIWLDSLNAWKSHIFRDQFVNHLQTPPLNYQKQVPWLIHYNGNQMKRGNPTIFDIILLKNT